MERGGPPGYQHGRTPEERVIGLELEPHFHLSPKATDLKGLHKSNDSSTVPYV